MLPSTQQRTCRPLEFAGSLDPALRAVITRAGIDPGLESAALQEALHCAISLHRSSCTWTKVPAGWVVTLQFPEQHRFFGETLEDALAWCLAWVMDQEATNSSGRAVLVSPLSDAYDGHEVG